jgi:ABC-type nitrate/sulfonate/bicarbonate transport system substrate-binding protein
MSPITAVAGALGLVLLSLVPASAQTRIAMTGFGFVSNLPIWVAQDRGLFKKEGLDVTIDQTQGSIAQIRDMMAGKYQIAMTSIDNIIAYTEGQSDTDQKIDGFDMVAFAGLHSGLNSVVARPEIKTFADIRGKTVVVDALTTGYAFLLFRILSEHGLRPRQDYQVIGIGGGAGRRQAMREGRAVVAVMSSPEDVKARQEGYNILATPADALAGGYQGSTYAVRRAWANDHEKELVGLIRAVAAAHESIYADHEGAIATLKTRLKDLSDADARATFGSLVAGKGGLNRNAEINIAGIKTVLSIRNEFATPKKNLDNPDKYVDLTYYRKAMGR